VDEFGLAEARSASLTQEFWISPGTAEFTRWTLSKRILRKSGVGF